MPTYEYTCDACGQEFELFQSMKAAPIRKCPNCGKSKARRLISAGAGLIFKGSGFYITDYRSDSYKSAAKSDSSGGSSTTSTGGGDNAKPAASSESSKTNNTPAPKAESKPAAPAKK